MSNKDELASVIASELNKTFKHQQVAYFLDGEQETPTDVMGWVSTGSTMLDLAISNRPDCGLAVGRITELNGLEGSGKSLIGAHALADTQRQGGVAVYIDTESAVSPDYLQAIGVDTQNMLYVHLETVEEIFDTIETIVTKIRESNKDRLVTILVDSLAAASTKVEMDADYDKDGWATTKAIVISKAMRKITQMIARQKVCLIFTNQLRQKLGVMFGDPWTTSGGKALPFHSSTRVRLKNAGQLKDGSKNTIGIKIKAQVAVKYKYPITATEISILCRQIDLETGELIKEYKFQSKDFEELMTSNSELRDYCYNMICKACILQYDSKQLGVDDVVETDEVVDEI